MTCTGRKLYIAAVLDCYNGEIVGLAMDDNMKKDLCVRAFEGACQSRSAHGMILHSDRGSQLTSADFRKTLARYDAVQSMSSTGHCYDNARMESFFCHAEGREALAASDGEHAELHLLPDFSDDVYRR